MSTPRFHIVTNDAARAALVFSCHKGNLPSWLVVIDEPERMLALPDGAKVRCYWFGSRETRTPWEGFWSIRKERGGLEWISEDEFLKIMAWVDEHRAGPSRLLLHGEDGSAITQAAEPIPDVEEAAASPDTTVNQPAESVKRKAKWS